MDDCNHFGCPPSFGVLAARTHSGRNVPERFHGADAPSELVRAQPTWNRAQMLEKQVQMLSNPPKALADEDRVALLEFVIPRGNSASDPDYHKRMSQL